MKKILFSMIASTLTATALIAAPQAVVFDWGNVLATDDRSVVVDFMCEAFQFSEAEFEAANLKKKRSSQAWKIRHRFLDSIRQRKRHSSPRQLVRILHSYS